MLQSRAETLTTFTQDRQRAARLSAEVRPTYRGQSALGIDEAMRTIVIMLEYDPDCEARHIER